MIQNKAIELLPSDSLESCEANISAIDRFESEVIKACDYERGQQYKAIKEGGYYKAIGTWEDYCESRGVSRAYVDRLSTHSNIVDLINTAPVGAVKEKTQTIPDKAQAYIDKAMNDAREEAEIELLNAGIVDVDDDGELITPTHEYQTRPLNPIPNEDKPQVWQSAVSKANGQQPTNTQVKAAVAEYKEAKTEPPPIEVISDMPNFITLDYWATLDQAKQAELLTDLTDKSKFNQQKNDNIEWALWSWNPITGCLHNCNYCYARDIANRFYSELGDIDKRFQPVLRLDRINAPSNTKQPDLSKVDDPIKQLGLKNVFVCSMADLFGKWLPSEWIELVLEQVRNNPQWNFLFLTKFPQRMAEFDYPANAWLGTSVDKQYAVARAEKAFAKLRDNGYQGVTWLSCEPMLEKLTFDNIGLFDWVVIGGSSKSTQTAEFYPPRDWINHLESQAYQNGCKVYEKSNLLSRIKEYPSG